MKKNIRVIILGILSFLLFLVAIVMIVMQSALWPLVLLASLLVLGTLIVLLRQHTPAASTTTTPDPSQEAAEAMVSLLSKQDKIVDEWKNTMETRDKLKLLKVSANSQNH